MTTEALAPGTHSVVLDGVRQVYHVAGTGPVCLVHSGGPGVHWNYVRMPLLEERLTLVYVEPVGSGASGLLPDGDYSPARYAHFCAELVRHLGVPQVNFIGHSHGGFVALQFGLDCPELTAGLVIYDAAPIYGAELMVEATRHVQLFATTHVGSREAQQVLEAWGKGTGETRESVLDFLNQMRPLYFKDYAEREDRLAPALAGLDATVDPNRKPNEWDVRDRLAELKMPVLVIVGVADFICGTKWAAEMDAGIAQAELLVLADSGHFGHVEEPEVFADAVIDFVGPSSAGAIPA